MIIKVQKKKNIIYVPSDRCLIISIVLIDQVHLNQLVGSLKKYLFEIKI